MRSFWNGTNSTEVSSHWAIAMISCWKYCHIRHCQDLSFPTFVVCNIMGCFYTESQLVCLRWGSVLPVSPRYCCPVGCFVFGLHHCSGYHRLNLFMSSTCPIPWSAVCNTISWFLLDCMSFQHCILLSFFACVSVSLLKVHSSVLYSVPPILDSWFYSHSWLKQTIFWSWDFFVCSPVLCTSHIRSLIKHLGMSQLFFVFVKSLFFW